MNKKANKQRLDEIKSDADVKKNRRHMPINITTILSGLAVALGIFIMGLAWATYQGRLLNKDNIGDNQGDIKEVIIVVKDLRESFEGFKEDAEEYLNPPNYDEEQQTDDEEGRDSVLILIKEIKADIREIRKNMNTD